MWPTNLWLLWDLVSLHWKFIFTFKPWSLVKTIRFLFCNYSKRSKSEINSETAILHWSVMVDFDLFEKLLKSCELKNWAQNRSWDQTKTAFSSWDFHAFWLSEPVTLYKTFKYMNKYYWKLICEDNINHKQKKMN